MIHATRSPLVAGLLAAALAACQSAAPKPPDGASGLTDSIEGRIHRLDRSTSPPFRDGRLWHGSPVLGTHERLGYALDLEMAGWADQELLRYVYPSDSDVEPLYARPLLGTVLAFDLDAIAAPTEQVVAEAGLERGDLFGVWGRRLEAPRIARSSFDPPPALVYTTDADGEFLL